MEDELSTTKLLPAPPQLDGAHMFFTLLKKKHKIYLSLVPFSYSDREKMVCGLCVCVRGNAEEYNLKSSDELLEIWRDEILSMN